MERRINILLVLMFAFFMAEVGGFVFLYKRGNDMSEKLASLQNKQVELATAKKNSSGITDLVKTLTPSVVSITVSKNLPKYQVVYQNVFGFAMPSYQQAGYEKKEVGAGSGFLITPDGYIVTNRHVVADANAEYLVQMSDGAKKFAKVVYRDTNNDLAIIKIDGSGYTPVSIGNSDTLQLGQSVIAIGNALGEYNNSVSTGIISGLDRTVVANDEMTGRQEELKGVIQTDAAINPGNSGGPLVDLNGQVVGINVATVIGSNNIAFSIPVNKVIEIIKRISEKK